MTYSRQYIVTLSGVENGISFSQSCSVVCESHYAAIGQALSRVESTYPNAQVSLSSIRVENNPHVSDFRLGRLNWSECTRKVSL